MSEGRAVRGLAGRTYCFFRTSCRSAGVSFGVYTSCFENFMTDGALFVLASGFRTSCFRIGYPVTRSVTKRVDFFICTIITAGAGIVCVPADFGTSGRLGFVVDYIVPEGSAVRGVADRADCLV